MMKINPTRRDVEELLAFLPIFDQEGFQPIIRWRGGASEGTCAWPEYDPNVERFFLEVAEEYWCDHGYGPPDISQMIRDEGRVAQADLAEIKSMLTWCVRGERFCDGHWGGVIDEGLVQRVLRRLAKLAPEMEDSISR